MADRQLKALTRTIKTFIESPEMPEHEFMKIMPAINCDGDPLTVYMLMNNAYKLNEEMAKDALYLFEITIASTIWPNGPPKGRALTPNGLFDRDANICISNGVYHPEQYKSIPLTGQIFAMYAAMVTNDKMLDHGIGVQRYDENRGRKIIEASRKSRVYTIEHYGDIVNAIETFYAEYSSKWPQIPPDADKTKYAPGIDGRYIVLPDGLRADHNEHVILVDKQPDNWPSLHYNWRKVKTAHAAGAVNIPQDFIVVDETDVAAVVDDLDNLGL